MTHSNTTYTHLINGKIWIEGNAFVESLIIQDKLIYNVGSNEEMSDIVKSLSTLVHVIDLHGRIVIPGLIDSHLHFTREGMNFNMELRWDGVKSLAAGMAIIKQQAARTPSGQWVRVVGGFTDQQMTEKRLPTIQELDDICPNVPVFILHLYDRALVNTCGLRVLKFSKSTTAPIDSVIVRDDSGEPTGELIAKPNAFLLYNTLNMLPKLDHGEQTNSTLAYCYELNRLGVTSVMDPGGGFQRFPEDYSVVQELDKANKLTIKVAYSLFPQTPNKELEDFKRWSTMVSPGTGSPYFRHWGAGEMLAFSAADFEDFRHDRPDLPAQMETDMDAITRYLLSIHWPFRLHATYGESIERELALFERIASDPMHAGKNPFAGLRWIIDHAETISDRDIDRIRDLGGGIAIQHRMAFQGEYFAKRYGADVCSNSPPIGSMIKSGIPVGGGTDGTRVATYNPFVSLYWLCTGKTVGGTVMYNDSNVVSRSKALELWTSSNAYLAHAENEKGKIVKGLAADLVVLSDDYFKVDAENIKQLQSHCTFVDGKIAYVHPKFQSSAKMDSSMLPVSAFDKLMPSWSPVSMFGGYQSDDTAAWSRFAVED